MSGSKDLTESLDSLMRRSRSQDNGDNSLPAAKPRGEVPAQRSSSLDAPGAGQANKGINSPLTETTYASREWFNEKTLMTTDGIFAVRVRALKKIFMTDAKSNSVEMEFKEQP